MFVISELSSAPTPDVVESEELSELLPNTKLNLKSESTHDAERDEDLPAIVTAAIIVLGSLVTILLSVIFVILYFRYQKRTKTKPLKAINRYGGPGLLNNEDKLLWDLISTKNKGVNDNMAGLVGYQSSPNNLEPPLEPVQLSPRDSLRSFFQDLGSKELNKQQKSATILTALDSCLTCV